MMISELFNPERQDLLHPLAYYEVATHIEPNTIRYLQLVSGRKDPSRFLRNPVQRTVNISYDYEPQPIPVIDTAATADMNHFKPSFVCNYTALKFWADNMLIHDRFSLWDTLIRPFDINILDTLIEEGGNFGTGEFRLPNFPFEYVIPLSISHKPVPDNFSLPYEGETRKVLGDKVIQKFKDLLIRYPPTIPANLEAWVNFTFLHELRHAQQFITINTEILLIIELIRNTPIWQGNNEDDWQTVLAMYYSRSINRTTGKSTSYHTRQRKPIPPHLYHRDLDEFEVDAYAHMISAAFSILSNTRLRPLRIVA